MKTLQIIQNHLQNKITNLESTITNQSLIIYHNNKLITIDTNTELELTITITKPGKTHPQSPEPKWNDHYYTKKS